MVSNQSASEGYHNAMMLPFELKALTKTYYNRLANPTVNDAEKFEQLIADIGNDSHMRNFRRSHMAPHSRNHVLEALMKKGCLESFGLLLSIFNSGGKEYFSKYMMFDCLAEGKLEFVEQMIVRGNIDSLKIVTDVIGIIRKKDVHQVFCKVRGFPFLEQCVSQILWLIERDPSIQHLRSNILHDAIDCILSSDIGVEAELVEMIKRLIYLGADISDDQIEVCQRKFPDNVAFHEMLVSAQIPDCKQPDC
jgi:hypothetical protein